MTSDMVSTSANAARLGVRRWASLGRKRGPISNSYLSAFCKDRPPVGFIERCPSNPRTLLSSFEGEISSRRAHYQQHLILESTLAHNTAGGCDHLHSLDQQTFACVPTLIPTSTSPSTSSPRVDGNNLMGKSAAIPLSFPRSTVSDIPYWDRL